MSALAAQWRSPPTPLWGPWPLALPSARTGQKRAKRQPEQSENPLTKSVASLKKKLPSSKSVACFKLVSFSKVNLPVVVNTTSFVVMSDFPQRENEELKSDGRDVESFSFMRASSQDAHVKTRA